jgi:hypothetical protein
VADCTIGLGVGSLATPHGSVATLIAADFAGLDAPPLRIRLLAPLAALAMLGATLALLVTTCAAALRARRLRPLGSSSPGCGLCGSDEELPRFDARDLEPVRPRVVREAMLDLSIVTVRPSAPGLRWRG